MNDFHYKRRGDILSVTSSFQLTLHSCIQCLCFCLRFMRKSHTCLQHLRPTRACAYTLNFWIWNKILELYHHFPLPLKNLNPELKNKIINLNPHHQKQWLFTPLPQKNYLEVFGNYSMINSVTFNPILF